MSVRAGFDFEAEPNPPANPEEYGPTWRAHHRLGCRGVAARSGYVGWHVVPIAGDRSKYSECGNCLRIPAVQSDLGME